MFKPQQVSQQAPQRFSTLEVQLTACKGTTTRSIQHTVPEGFGPWGVAGGAGERPFILCVR